MFSLYTFHFISLSLSHTPFAPLSLSQVQKGYKIPKECQYWVIGSQLAEDKQTVADLKLTKDTAVFVYVQHPHKAKVHKKAMRSVPQQPIIKPHKNVPLGPRGWTCHTCTYTNMPYRTSCELCGSTRPNNYLLPPY